MAANTFSQVGRNTCDQKHRVFRFVVVLVLAVASFAHSLLSVRNVPHEGMRSLAFLVPQIGQCAHI